MSSSDVSRPVMLAFVELLQSRELNEELNPLQLHVKNFFLWVQRSSLPAAKTIMEKMEEKAARRKTELKQSMFLGDENAAMCELGTEFLRQVLRAALAVHTYALKDGRIREYFFMLFKEKKLGTTLLNGGTFLQYVLDTSARRKQSAVQKLPLPTSFEGLLFFHALVIFNREVGKKTVKCARNSVNSSLAGRAVQIVQRAWNALTETCGLGPFRLVVRPYLWFNPTSTMFQVLAKRADGFVSLRQNETLVGEAAPVEGPLNVDPVAWNRSLEEDEALRYVSYLMLEALSELISNDALYMRGDDLPELKQYTQEDEGVPMTFATLPESVVEALKIKRPQPPAITVTELDEDGNVVMQEQVRPLEAPVFKNHLLMYSETGWADPRLSLGTLRRSASGTPQSGKSPKRGRTGEDGQPPTPIPIVPQPDLKEEDVIDDVEPAETLMLSAEAKAAMRALRKAMAPVCAVYDVPFQSLITEHDMMTSRSLRGTVDFVLTDPPYNVRREVNAENSEHDKFSFGDMQKMSELLGELMKPGAHGHVFCSTLQFAKWHKVLSRERKKVARSLQEELEDDREGEGAEVTDEAAFEVESVALHYIRAVGNNSQPARMLRALHTSVVETAIHFWKRGGSWDEVMSHLDYKGHGNVPTNHRWWTNVLNNVPGVHGSERVLQETSGSEGAAKMVRPEQKSIELMKDLLVKFSSPGEVVLDTCAGTFATAKACMLLPEHRRFVGCEKDGECFSRSLGSVVEVYAKQLLNPESDIEGSEATKKLARVYLEARAAIASKVRTNAWSVPAGLSAVQTFPPHILHYLSNRSKSRMLIERCRHIPFSQWGATWRGALLSEDVDVLLSVECCANGMSVKKSTIQHPNAGLGVFAERKLGKNHIVGYYYGSLVYSDLTQAQHTAKRYGEGMMGVTVDAFCTWANRIPEMATDREGKEHPVWIVAAPFCAMRYVNDGRYLPGDTSSQSRRVKNPRENNVVFRQQHSPRTSAEFQDYGLLAVETLRNIRVGEELFVDYGNVYEFR